MASLIASASALVADTSVTRLPRVPLEVRVDHAPTRRFVMIDPVDVTGFGQLARNNQRTLAIPRIPQPQRERRVPGVAEPVHRVELDCGVRLPDRRTHRARMPDRKCLMCVTHEGQRDTLLDRELDDDVRCLQVDQAASSATCCLWPGCG
jgi:hypothetical protein